MVNCERCQLHNSQFIIQHSQLFGVTMQKTAVSIIIATLLSLLLLGCRQEEGVGTVTAVAVATTPPTVTSSPTVVVTETAVATATNTPEPTPTLVTHSPFPTRPAALPTVAFQTDVDYKLVTPTSNALLETIRRIGEFDDIYIEHGGASTYWQVHNMVKADMDNFYPFPFPNATELLNDLSLTSYYL